MLKIYNVLSKSKDEFKPLDAKNVKMYACGITVSDDAHIGHAKQALQFDMVRRYLEFKGFKVTYVRNHTDVDDKIIANANKINMNALDYAKKYVDRINKDLKELGVRPANFEPKASETIPEIIEFVQALIDKKLAYVADNGDVFYIVKEFKNYGYLSNRITEDGISGVRKAVSAGKQDDVDFALWKSAKPGEISWDSPWGKGRPGWHIECSAMCYKFLGETIDIHGGGKDLIFPHHENEIAQSEGRFNVPLANYWMHCGLVKINGMKMSKSLGNGIMIKDALKKYEPEVIKLVIFQTNYRNDLNITSGIFEDAEKLLYSYYKNLQSLEKLSLSDKKSELALNFEKKFEEAMDDDFNTILVLAHLYELNSKVSEILKQPKQHEQLNGIYSTIKTLFNTMAMFQEKPDKFLESIKSKYIKEYKLDTDYINDLIQKRQNFRDAKRYDLADEIKTELLNMGLQLSDTKSNTEWVIDFNSKKKQ